MDFAAPDAAQEEEGRLEQLMARNAGSAVFASYNIHKCVGSDRRFDPHRVQTVIGQIGADVIALQEADRRFGDRAGLLDLRALAAATGLVPVPVDNRHRGHGHHGNLMLVREGTVRGLRQINLPGLEPRGATGVQGFLRHRMQYQHPRLVKDLRRRVGLQARIDQHLHRLPRRRHHADRERRIVRLDGADAGPVCRLSASRRVAAEVHRISPGLRL